MLAGKKRNKLVVIKFSIFPWTGENHVTFVKCTNLSLKCTLGLIMKNILNATFWKSFIGSSGIQDVSQLYVHKNTRHWREKPSQPVLPSAFIDKGEDPKGYSLWPSVHHGHKASGKNITMVLTGSELETQVLSTLWQCHGILWGKIHSDDPRKWTASHITITNIQQSLPIQPKGKFLTDPKSDDHLTLSTWTKCTNYSEHHCISD